MDECGYPPCERINDRPSKTCLFDSIVASNPTVSIVDERSVMETKIFNLEVEEEITLVEHIAREEQYAGM